MKEINSDSLSSNNVCEWVFPHGVGLTETGSSNSSIEHFLDDIDNSLTREVIQNSLDAKNTLNKDPVFVEFDLFYIPTKDIPRIDTIKNYALPKAKENWKDKGDTYDYLLKFEETLKEENVQVLRVSDYNTKGLNNDNYKSLVLGNSYSKKDFEDSAGSKGVGKAAPFAASDLRMVFYNTVPTEEKPKSVGVMNFVSFKFEKESKIQTTQERVLYYDKKEDNRCRCINEQTSFNNHNRPPQEYGTDLYIIGLKKMDNWKQQIILSVLNNFLISIFDNQLEVNVLGNKINSGNIKEYMEEFNEKKDKELKGKYKSEFEKTYNYYEVITNENHLVKNFDERFDKYDFIKSKEDGVLYLLKHENPNRTVLQTRKAGMKIYERNRISGNISFSGVFQARGDELNSFLKDMENPNHNTWSTDRLSGKEIKKGKEFLTDLLQWYKSEVNEAYGIKSNDEIDAFGTSDFLPLRDKQDGESKHENVDSGIIQKIKDIKVKQTSSLKIKSESAESAEKELVAIIENIEVDQGSSGSIYNYNKTKKKVVREHVETDFVGSDYENGYFDKGEKETIKGKKEKVIEADNIINVKKMIAIDASKGHYRFFLKAFRDTETAKILLKYIGADGKSNKIKVINADTKSHRFIIKNDCVRIKKLKKNDSVVMDIYVDSKLPMKMESSVYEVKT